MTNRPKYPQVLSPTAPTIISKSPWGGQAAERQLKKPREHERENIDICNHHCPRPNKPCSGSDYRMEKCRREYERSLEK